MRLICVYYANARGVMRKFRMFFPFFFFPLFLLVRQVNTCWRITSEKRVLYTLIKIYGFMSGSLLNHSNIYFHLHV